MVARTARFVRRRQLPLLPFRLVKKVGGSLRGTFSLRCIDNRSGDVVFFHSSFFDRPRKRVRFGAMFMWCVSYFIENLPSKEEVVYCRLHYRTVIILAGADTSTEKPYLIRS